VLTFQLDILDVFGNGNVLRTAIAALDETLRIDNTMQGLVEDAFITLRSVAERKDDERSVVGAVITVQIEEGLPDPGLIHLLDFSDASKFSITAGSEIQDSTIVRGAVGIKKTLAGPTMSLTASSATGQSGFPIDLSDVKRLRYFTYRNPENQNPPLTVQLATGLDFSNYETGLGGGIGWEFPSYDLSTPVLISGSGADLSDITAVSFLYNWGFFQDFVSTTFGILAADLAYHPRDTGDNAGRGYHSGF
jgi:hypothetical protein